VVFLEDELLLLLLKESIFHEDEKDRNDIAHDASWWIPLSMAAQDERWPKHNLPRYWLPSHESLELEDMEPMDRWVYFNINRTGLIFRFILLDEHRI